jgi:anti-sigma-K factor RskA
MPEQTHVLDLIPAYALGSLEAEEARQVQAHLLSCLVCRAEARAFEDLTAGLGLLVPPADPPSALKERLLGRLHSSSARTTLPERRAAPGWMGQLLPAWSLVSLVLILALAVFSFLTWQRSNGLQPTTNPGGMQAVALLPAQSGSPATGFVIIGADGRNGALVVDNLPPLGEDRKYQLWLIRDGQRTSGALFSTDEESYGGTRVRAPRPLNEYSAVEITIEPAQGSPQPTGELVLKASLLEP